MPKKRIITSLILNIIIFIMEIIALKICIKTGGLSIMRTYTVESNILALIGSLIYCVYSILILNKKISDFPKWLCALKYVITVSLTITFLVVVFILVPTMTQDNNYRFMLLEGSMLYQHTLCPIITFISFIFFEKGLDKGYKNYLNAISFTIIYAIVSVILNILKIMEGPYPFLMVYKQPIYMSIIWFIMIIGGAYLLSYAINIINIKVKKN